ncbi:MAG: MogA/MoaB family molybdenum cofactor biosynthesis protein [Candidatus Bathyarchaeota archaeon]|nr:MogA/MoaB family molybdenum cofactor biosynthesis protein [Candidatus Bathyarchaeota archaeon]
MSETAARHKAEAPRSLNFAVIVCSTSRHEEFAGTGRFNDPTGDLIVKIVKNNGHRVTLRRIVSDDKSEIQQVVLKALKSRKVNVILTSGGTGISPRDVTIEAVQPLLEKEIQGFGELFRAISFDRIGSAAVLTRAIAGVARGKAIFCLPGSPQSVSLALEELILPEAGHILKHVRER